MPSDALAKTAARTRARLPDRQDSFPAVDPCAALQGDELDDCVARDDSRRAGNGENADESSLDRPELSDRDRQMMEADEAAARDREQSDSQYPQSQYDPYPSQDDQSQSQDNTMPDQSSDDYPQSENNPPDDNSDQSPPNDQYHP